MTIEQIVKKFTDNPIYLTNGAGLLSKKWNCNKGDIYEAKRIIRNKTKEEIESKAKILVFDLETSPIISYHFNTRKEFIQPE